MTKELTASARDSRAPEHAVLVRNAVKSYGVGSRRTTILKGIDMDVRRGTIYGLLGASGCGKTTLLSCIVGRRRFDSGDVKVFGAEPGTPESGIPGSRVGYMPQELALYGEFTISETLEYFGRIYNLSAEFVKAQMDFLFGLLDLPPGDRYVKSLSGGQQRRVSFAVALFHKPELLILDEPTVGVDPLLRHSIWNHLVRLSSDHKHTVIITTHYIEEARQAHAIGMMRSGRLLAQESPANLLSQYRLESLEDVFLKLCKKDNIAQGPDAAQQESSTYLDISNHRAVNGHDNPAFEHSFGASRRQHERDDLTGLNQLALVPAHKRGPYKSTLPSDEDGIVGLAFSPSSDNIMLHALNNKHSLNQNNYERQKNRFNTLVNGGVHEGTSSSYGCKRPPDAGSSSDARIYCQKEDHRITRDLDEVPVAKKRRRSFSMALPSPHRTAALIRKNLTQTFRNIGMFLFVFLLPAAQAILFCLAIGHDPTFLKVAVVNDELNLNAPQTTCDAHYLTDCTYSMFSCRYLRYLSNETVIQVPYNDLKEALEATKQGEIWGVIHFGRNFTDELVVRQGDGSAAQNETILASRINVYLDYSDRQISVTLERLLADTFQDFSQDILSACAYEADAAGLPVTFLDPVYGSKDGTFTDFMAPGIILTIVYFIAVALTAGVFINERKQGLLDRCLVAGVQMSEILIAHLTNQFIVLIGQTTLVYLVMMLAFRITCTGSVMLAVILTLLQGLTGMSYGLLISSACDEETSAIQLALGSFYPNLMMSGVIWPLEGLQTPEWFRKCMYMLPQTYAIESLRNIFARGWGMNEPEVYVGIIISIGWIIVLLTASLAVVRLRKYTG